MAEPKRITLFAISLTSMVVLVLEIVFTRVFSVLMWYHFAFMVISLALLGSGAAGVWLYLAQRRFPPEKVNRQLSLLALLFALGTPAAFYLYLQIPFEFKTITKDGLNWATVGWLALIYLNLSIPFLLGGATIALAVSRFNQIAGRVADERVGGRQRLSILSLIAVVGFQLLVLPYLITWTQPWPLLLRIALVVVVIFPAGFFMGQPFPWGQMDRPPPRTNYLLALGYQWRRQRNNNYVSDQNHQNHHP